MNQHIGIIGLGYVGAVSAACLARLGHHVYGFEQDPLKIERLKAGQAPFFEPGLEEMLAAEVARGQLEIHRSIDDLLDRLDVVLICVGTPSLEDGSHNYGQLARVFDDLATKLKSGRRSRELLIAVRSTVTPGTTAAFGRRYFDGVHQARLAYNPEFLREGTAIKDFFQPALVVVGAADDEAARQLQEVYSTIDAPHLSMSLEAAEMVKGVCNAFHALKIAFANETGSLAARCGVNPEELMKVICADTRLNISAVYMKPGFAFGGSCLPKDLRATSYLAKTRDVELPMLASILVSNEHHLGMALQKVKESGCRKIGLIGLAFKTGTDDLRESALVKLAEQLIGKGYQISIYDPEVHLSQLLGANRRYIEEHLPHLGRLVRSDIKEVIHESEFLVVGRSGIAIEEALIQFTRPDQRILDLVNMSLATGRPAAAIAGLCW